MKRRYNITEFGRKRLSIAGSKRVAKGFSKMPKEELKIISRKAANKRWEMYRDKERKTKKLTSSDRCQ